MTANSLDTGNSAAGSTWNHFLFRVICKLGTVGTGLIAIVAGLLYAKQESLLYFPEISGIPRRPASNPRNYRSPSEYDIPFTSHMIKCADNVSIHAWLLLQKHNTATSPTIIFFHGNAGNIGLRLPNAAQMYKKLGCNIFMVEYRGYGDSEDCKPNESGLKLDAEAAYQFLLNAESSNIDIDTSKIFVFGRSLGGAVAFHLAKYGELSINKPLRGIIVENTFTSISKMVDQLMPAIAPLKFLVLRMDWNSERIAPILKTPVLYLAGDIDELVPHSQMQDLYKKSLLGSVYAKMHIIRNGTHNDSWVQGGREYYKAINAFMSHVIIQGDSLLTTAKLNSVNGLSTSLSDTGSSMEVTLGGELSEVNEPIEGTIPIMPSNMIGMAKEASISFSTNAGSASNKKKEI